MQQHEGPEACCVSAVQQYQLLFPDHHYHSCNTMLIPSKWQLLSCFHHNRQHLSAVKEAWRTCPTKVLLWDLVSPMFILMVIYKNHSHCAHWGVMTEYVCVWVLQMFPHAHILCHHFSNQPPREPDWIINYPINASLHSVRLSASKYLPMQNNSRRLDYHFKLLLCVVHNQEGGERKWWYSESRADRGKFSSFTPFSCRILSIICILMLLRSVCLAEEGKCRGLQNGSGQFILFFLRLPLKCLWTVIFSSLQRWDLNMTLLGSLKCSKRLALRSSC